MKRSQLPRPWIHHAKNGRIRTLLPLTGEEVENGKLTHPRSIPIIHQREISFTSHCVRYRHADRRVGMRRHLEPVRRQSAPPPAPTLTAISPNTAAAGGAAFTLTITGTNFVAASTVNFGGAAPATTFISSTQLSAAIPASSIGSTGTLSVTVTNPAPGGGTSNSVNFTITSSSNSVPSISTFSPNCAPAGEQLVDAVDNVLTVFGDNFVASSVVQWNGADLPTTFNSNAGEPYLTAQVPASDIAAAGMVAITVFNPPPGGGTSGLLDVHHYAGSSRSAGNHDERCRNLRICGESGLRWRRWWLRVHVLDQPHHRCLGVDRSTRVHD